MLSESSAGFVIFLLREVCCLDVPKWFFDELISVKISKTRCIKINLSKFDSSLIAMCHVGSIFLQGMLDCGGRWGSVHGARITRRRLEGKGELMSRRPPNPHLGV